MGVRERRIEERERLVFTRETNEDQVEVPGVNYQSDRQVSECFPSTNGHQSRGASTNNPRVIGIPTFFLYSFKRHGISNGDTLEHNRS